MKRQNRQKSFFSIEEFINEIPEILAPKNEGEKLIKWASELGENLKNRGMTTSQIRKIFSLLKDKDLQVYDLNMIRAKLAYVAGRHRSQVGDLQKALDEMIKYIINSSFDFEHNVKVFRDFFEAVVAYHRKFGGKEG